MSAQQDKTYYIGATRIALGVLGASLFPTLISPPSGCVGGYLRYLSGGSIEILPNAGSGKTYAGATAGGLGYLLGTTEVYDLQGPAAFYVACGSAATVVIQLSFHYSAGGASLV